MAGVSRSARRRPAWCRPVRQRDRRRRSVAAMRSAVNTSIAPDAIGTQKPRTMTNSGYSHAVTSRDRLRRRRRRCRFFTVVSSSSSPRDVVLHFTFRRSISRRFFLSFSLSRSVITTIMVMSLIKRPVGTRLRNDSRQVVHTHHDPCAPVSKHASPYRRGDASGRHTARCWRWRARRGCVTALGKLFTPIMTHVPLSASTRFR